MKKIILTFSIALIFQNSHAQLSQASRDSLNKLSQADHQHMMKQLGIEK